MNRWVAVLMFSLLGWCNAGSVLAQTEGGAERLPALVFQYLDSTDSDEAEELLRAIQQHPDASIERVIRIIETERSYDSQPIGTLPG